MNGRNQRLHFRFAFALAVALSVLAARTGLAASSGAEESLNFSLPNLDGSTFTFQDEAKDGQLILFDFWATWCGPCLLSLPAVEKIAADYADRGLRVFTVNVDTPEQHGKIPLFIKKHKLGLPVLLDSTLQLLRGLELSGVPAAAIFSADGLLHKEQGYGSGSDTAQRHRIDDLLLRFGPQSSAASK